VRTLNPQRNGLLLGKTIFLSASVPDRVGFERVPAAAFIIEQAVIGLARAVFSEGGKIVFGAHPSISPLVASVASEYTLPGAPEDERSVVIYQSRAFEDLLPKETWDMYRFGFARLVWTEAQQGEHFVAGQAASPTCPASLQHMRSRMLQETRPLVMVTLGGMGGVIEEAQMFRTFNLNRAPSDPVPFIYSAKLTGGAAALLAGPLLPEFPLLRVIEDDWQAAGGWTANGTDLSTRDSREDSMPPYRAMLQWLVGEIGRTTN
jgi:hypothetical protein